MNLTKCKRGLALTAKPLFDKIMLQQINTATNRARS